MALGWCDSTINNSMDIANYLNTQTKIIRYGIRRNHEEPFKDSRDIFEQAERTKNQFRNHRDQ